MLFDVNTNEKPNDVVCWTNRWAVYPPSLRRADMVVLFDERAVFQTLRLCTNLVRTTTVLVRRDRADGGAGRNDRTRDLANRFALGHEKLLRVELGNQTHQDDGERVVVEQTHLFHGGELLASHAWNEG